MTKNLATVVRKKLPFNRQKPCLAWSIDQDVTVLYFYAVLPNFYHYILPLLKNFSYCNLDIALGHVCFNSHNVLINRLICHQLAK